MSTLYIRHPSKASIDSAAAGTVPACAFALANDAGAVTREGSMALAAMGSLVAQARRVVVLIAASDVTLLRMSVPPLSGAKLKAALPNLVEDQLITDPADSVIVAGTEEDGVRTIAVAQRAWLAQVAQSLVSLGARSIALYPEQLCLPCRPEHVCAAVALHGEVIDLTLRLSAHGGLGIPVMPELDASGQPASSAVRDVLQSVRMLAPQGPLTLFVPAGDVASFQMEADADTTVAADAWAHWIRGSQAGVLDLMPALGAAGGSGVDWRRWRWPALLAALVVLLNIVGLNVEWLRMKREAEGLRAVMLQTFRTAYPKETVIHDPLAQMRQKIALARNEAGQAAPDDFIALTAGFGEAWASVASEPNAKDALAGVDYRERSLFVHVKPNAESLLEKIRPALASRNLAVAQATGGVWQIKPAR